MKWGKVCFGVLLAGFLVFLYVDIKLNPGMNLNWSILSLGMALLGLLGFFLKFESSKPPAGEVALLATMSALAALGRVPFAAIPNVQPTTFLVITSGYVLGPGAGFTVGAMAALTSNFFLGLGPWTPWQMMAWGLAGLTSGMLAKVTKNNSRFVLVTFSLGWGYFYGLIMNTWHWLTYIYPLNWETFLATYAAGFAFDTLHAVGNGLFMYLMGTEIIKVLQRFARRLSFKTIEANAVKMPGVCESPDGDAK